eukprot:8183864-Pyramimonas_sp.AAC.2
MHVVHVAGALLRRQRRHRLVPLHLGEEFTADWGEFTGAGGEITGAGGEFTGALRKEGFASRS